MYYILGLVIYFFVCVLSKKNASKKNANFALPFTDYCNISTIDGLQSSNTDHTHRPICKLTLVTAFIHINQDNDHIGKYKSKRYMDWLTLMFSLKGCLTIYVSPKYPVDVINYYFPNGIPARVNMIIVDINSFLSLKEVSLQFWEELTNKRVFMLKGKKNMMLDKFSGITYAIWNEKINFIFQAKEANVFSSDWFTWIDMGFWRSQSWFS